MGQQRDFVLNVLSVDHFAYSTVSDRPVFRLVQHVLGDDLAEGRQLVGHLYVHELFPQHSR